MNQYDNRNEFRNRDREDRRNGRYQSDYQSGRRRSNYGDIYSNSEYPSYNERRGNSEYNRDDYYRFRPSYGADTYDTSLENFGGGSYTPGRTESSFSEYYGVGNRGNGPRERNVSGYTPRRYDNSSIYDEGDWSRYGSPEYREEGNYRSPARKTSHAGKGPRGYTRSDDRLKEDVCEKLYANPYIDASDIEVNVDQGTVSLTGEVTDRWMKYEAEELVDNLYGVKTVRNNIEVVPESSFSSQYSNNQNEENRSNLKQ